MSLSHCIDKAQNEIRRQKILLQKANKPQEAAVYEVEQNAALNELKGMLDIPALDGEQNKGKAITKLKSVIESLSLDRDEVVIQIEAKGGKATAAPFKMSEINEGAVVELPVLQLTFEQWLENRFEASEYKDAYLERADGNKRQAMLDANGIGGTEDRAMRSYLSELFSQPRNADISLDVYDAIPDNAKVEATRHFYQLEKKINDRYSAQAIESNRIEAEAIKPYQDALDLVNADIKKKSERSGPTTAAENALLKRRYALEGAINDIRQGRTPDGRILRNKEDSAPELEGNRRDPMTVNIFNPYMEGDIVSIGGKIVFSHKMKCSIICK